ncbi:MAG: hypothetical protein QM503_11985, partial [Bacteroidota bacterium]
YKLMCKFGLEITSVFSGTICPVQVAQYARYIHNAYGSGKNAWQNYAKQVGGSPSEAKSGYETFKSRWSAQVDEYKNQISQFHEFRRDPVLNPYKTNSSITDPIGSVTDGKISKGLTDISGGGTQMRNVTIHIDRLNENININTTTLSEATPEIEAQLTESLIRAIGGAEQIIGN